MAKAKKAQDTASMYRKKPKKNNKGVHSKNGARKKKYRGQGR